MKYTPPIRRRNVARGHVYEDANGRPVTGVTTILSKGWPKPQLPGWSARTVAETAVNRWDELAQLPISVRLKELKDAPWADRDAAARRGTEVHDLAEQLVAGHRVNAPDELAGHVDAYVKFLNDADPEPVLVEAVVANYTIGYAGTLDLIADIRGERWLLDIKTTRSGVYGETAYQLAAYRYAEKFLGYGEQPMIPVDRCAVVWVRSDGYSFKPMTVGPAEFRQFRYIYENCKAADIAPTLIGDEITWGDQ